MDLEFRPLTDDDLPMLHGWLNEPGVIAWWEGDDVSWGGVVRDYMREPPPGPFDAVANLFSSFGYFAHPAEDARCLRAWHDVLRPGGVLVMDLMHRDAVARLWGGDEPEGRGEGGTTDWVTDMRTASVEVAGRRRVFRVRLHTATELVRMLHEAGFVEVDVRGGLDGRPFDPSTRLAVRARRA